MVKKVIKISGSHIDAHSATRQAHRELIVFVLIWPKEGPVGNKLHGTATDLLLTVRFIALTGLHI